MLRNNNTVWFDKLQLACDIKNNQRNSTIKKRPVDVWVNTPFNPQRYHQWLKVFDDINKTTFKKAIMDVAKNKTHEFNIGDLVRVKMSSLYSQIRRLVKEGDKKYVIVTYSPDIYRITHILAHDRTGGYERNRYKLEDLQGNPLLIQLKKHNPNHERRSKIFFANEMQLVNKDTLTDKNVNPDFTIKDALKLYK